MKLIGCLLTSIRKCLGLLFILWGSIPTLLIPGIGLFLGLPFLLIGGILLAC
ncbi:MULTISPECIES: hypothetical protein [unclassified Microcoleus]|jgi:small multidrug resistance pump|uniref:hypothetical protein n=1 Tax=unclassified Microcoleus TaxID=2642155 RepID=UPI00168281E7|nr:MULTISPECIES: hypothetical protein [unclassified Microcoleus]MBD1938789.1 hypothetical protein [Microcoleus sp. FACHB-68]MBD2039620.1 hypothetical protein [Microcoleus sp. FACHB-672]MBW4680110.1 hypothetical protein [Microcoleus vaginatus WJT46-NPBG5]